MSGIGSVANLTARDLRQSRDLAHALSTLEAGDPSASALLVSELISLLGAEKAIAYGLSSTEEQTKVDFLEAANADDGGDDFVRFIESGPRRVSAFDPRRPEARQRNVVVTLEDLGPTVVNAPAVAILERYGVAQHDQIRVLVCQGPALLAFVGAYREEKFGLRERRLLESLVPTMKQRLTLERTLRDPSIERAAVEAILEAASSPAFLVSKWGTTRLANTAGRAMLAADRRGLESTLADCVRRETPGVDVTKVVARGMPDHFLVFFREPIVDPRPRVLRAAAKWGLTRRQTEVFLLVARGEANKTIAASLGCVERTVELHLTTIFRKARCQSRTQLIAALWSER